MRTLLVALVALALLAPGAAAQVTPLSGQLPATNIQLDAAVPDHAIGDDPVAIPVAGLLAAPVGVSLNALTVELRIESAPPWAFVAFTPSSVLVNFQPSANLVNTAPFGATMVVATTEHAPPGELGEIVFSAFTHGGGTAGPGYTTTSIVFRAAGEDCHHEIESAALVLDGAPEKATPEPTTVETASAGVMPVSGSLVGGLALLGAAGGGAYVLRRKAEP